MNFKITNNISDIDFAKSLLIEIDGASLRTLKKFYKYFATKLGVEGYFGQNLDAFDEVINDLSWLDELEVYLYFIHLEDFLSNEDIETKELIFSLLDEAADNQKNTSDGTPIHIIVENTPYTYEFLEEIGIDYAIDL